MTVPSTPLRADSTGNGVGLNHPYTWKINTESELTVIKVNDSTEEETTLVLNTDYTVTGVGNESGGNVVINPALPTGYSLVILSNVAYQQDTDFTNQNSVPPQEIENALDKLSKQTKQIVEILNRTVTVSPGSGTNVDDYLTEVKTAEANASASANAAATSEANAATSETNAAASANAAAASAAEGLYNNVVSKSFADSPITPAASEEGTLFKIDTSGGNVVVNLSSLATYAEDMKFAFVKVTNDANTITINRGGTDTINGNTSLTITEQYETHALIGDSASGVWIDTVQSTGIADGSVTNAKLADMAQATIKGRASGVGTGAPTDLSGTQVRTIADVYSKSETDSAIAAVADEVFTSTEQTITLSNHSVISHGLSAIPRDISFYLVCKTAEHGYAIDDRVYNITPICDTGGNYSPAIIVSADTTYIHLTVGSYMRFLNQNTAAVISLTAGNWKIVMRAVV